VVAGDTIRPSPSNVYTHDDVSHSKYMENKHSNIFAKAVNTGI
jgi:hypothetical protein